MKIHRSLVCILMLLLGLGLSARDSGPQPIRALLITGGGWHDYKAQESLLTEGISRRVNVPIQWTIVHEGGGEPDHKTSILQQENWAAGYDIVVHNTGFGRVRDADFVARFVSQHKGTPAVLIHAAVHSYRYAEPADSWFAFMGMQSMFHERQRPLEVENVAPEHPIMQGFPQKWTSPPDELYAIEKVWGDITPLARAHGQETGKYHTVSWTHESPGIKIFATTLGHNNEIFGDDVFMNKVARGFLWAVGRN